MAASSISYIRRLTISKQTHMSAHQHTGSRCQTGGWGEGDSLWFPNVREEVEAKYTSESCVSLFSPSSRQTNGGLKCMGQCKRPFTFRTHRLKTCFGLLN